MNSPKKTKKKSSRHNQKRQNRSKSNLFRIRLLIIILAIVTIVILVLTVGRLSRNNNDRSSTTASNVKNDFSMLLGNWMRPDGGYILKINSVDPGGRVNAGYYNPNPINISEAFVFIEKGRMKLFVKLQDKGYPGSTYTLFYNPSSEAFSGIYYQAARGQSYEVVFVRKK